MPDLSIDAFLPDPTYAVEQLTGSDPRLAEEAEAALVEWGPDAVVALAEALARAPLAARPRVVAVLRRRGGADALAALEGVTLLARHLQQSAAEPFQIALIEALEELGGARRVHAVLRLLSVERPAVQRRAAQALVGCGRAAIPGLCAALGSTQASVREIAAEALGEVGDASVIDALNKALWDTRGYHPNELTIRATLALGKVAERHPSLRLRSVLPALRGFSDRHSNRRLYQASRWAKSKVQAALRKVRSTPIPAQAPPHSLRLLPLPSAEDCADPKWE